MRKNAYIRAALKSAGITRLQYDGFWPKSDKQNAKITIFENTLKALGFVRREGIRSMEYHYTKEDESVTIKYRFGDKSYNAFWINN